MNVKMTVEKVNFKKIFSSLKFEKLFLQLKAHHWFVSEMGRASSFSSASIGHPGSSWAPPSGHIPQCSAAGDCQVASRHWGLSHKLHLECVVNVAFVCFQIYGLLDGQTGLCVVVEPDRARKAANQGRFGKNKPVVGCFSVGSCVYHYLHICVLCLFCLLLLLPLLARPPGWRAPVGRLQLRWRLSWWEPA